MRLYWYLYSPNAKLTSTGLTVFNGRPTELYAAGVWDLVRHVSRSIIFKPGCLVRHFLVQHFPVPHFQRPHYYSCSANNRMEELLEGKGLWKSHNYNTEWWTARKLPLWLEIKTNVWATGSMRSKSDITEDLRGLTNKKRLYDGAKTAQLSTIRTCDMLDK